MKHHLLYRLIILLGVLGVSCSIYAREALITNVDQLYVNHQNPDDNYSFTNLIDPDTNKHYYSGEADGWTDPAYLQVSLNSPLSGAGDSPDKDKNLVIMVKRPNYSGWTREHPIAFEVKGILDDDTEVTVCYVYLLYRGMGTSEYSSRISLSKLWENPQLKGKEIKGLKFIVTANNGIKYNSKTGYREMCMSYFQIYKMDQGENYSEIFKDRLHRTTDYLETDLMKYEFVNTRGIADDINKSLFDRGDNWTIFNEADLEVLEQNGIDVDKLKLPDFSFIEGGAGANPPLDEGQSRQPTHTVEHIVYAIPGDVVGLYPYYQMSEFNQYQENFSHWYNYRTGGRYTYKAPWSGIDYDLLDFAIDPTNAVKSDKYGFYTSQSFTTTGRKFEVHNVNDYIAAVSYANDHNSPCYIELAANLNFEGVTNVPMLGVSEEKAFNGFLNGNGFTIRNLVIDRPNSVGVGLVGHTKGGARIQNLVIDGSCTFIGHHNVGLIGQHHGDSLSVYNIRTEANLYAANYLLIEENDGTVKFEQSVAGIVGFSGVNTNRVTIKDCYIGGKIGDPDQEWYGRANGYVAGWMGLNGNNAYAEFTNILIAKDCKLNGDFDENYYIRTQSGSVGKIRVTNCYGPKAVNGFKTYTEIPKELDWEGGKPPVNVAIKDDEKIIKNPGDRVTGTFATFFCPRSPYQNAGNQESLPFESIGDVEAQEEELVIAADFSQEFSIEKHVNVTDKEIYEPIIFTRHLFKIRDGKEFADAFSGSPTNNDNFVRKNQKMVSARAGKAFQIRFDTPVPKEPTSRSNYYYKLADNDYRRVCSMEIRVYDSNMNDITFKEGTPKFDYGEPFTSQGSRIIDSVNYSLCGGGTEYYRMLKCDNPKEGEYIVRLIGKDVNGDIIKVFGDPKHDLVVMQYVITFLPEKMSVIVTEAELYDDNGKNEDKYAYARPETLEERYGNPEVINFDNYMEINKISNERVKNKFVTSNPDLKNGNTQINRTEGSDGYFESSYFKWPLSWESCNYSFGYNKRHDFNMYMLATHSMETPNHSYIPDNGENNEDYKGHYTLNNNYGDDLGVFDRKYYTTLRESREKSENAGTAKMEDIEQGYFYYVNAATDPGVAARLKVETLCPGSTVHVSAWIAEFTKYDETVNLSFNFVAVLNDNLGNKDIVADGIKGGDRIVLHSFITGYAAQDNRATWLNVYYSFVPRFSEFSSQGITDDMVDHYELELDNNCKSSIGADYAVDDIRVYIAKPEILAMQLSPMCEGAAEIRVESPFYTLLQTCGEQEVVGEEDGEEVPLLYTFIDKAKFDYLYHSEDSEYKDNYKEAFDASVVKFDYDGRGETTTGEYTYGRLTFNTKLANNPEYNSGNENEDGETVDNQAQRRDKDGRDMIVFTSRLTDDMFSVSKEYYVVLATPQDDKNEISIQPGSEYLEFDIFNDCAKMCTVTITPSQVVKIDGKIVSENADFEICENQSPVLQVNVRGLKTDSTEDDEMVDVEKNARFDWYFGSMEEFLSDENDEGISLYDALMAFRDRDAYPNASDFEDVNAKGEFTEEMLELLLAEEKNLRLYETSFVVPPISFGEGETKVVVSPIDTEKMKDVVFCMEPAEITLLVKRKSPKLQHGLTVIKYPELMEDVPLRIGLKQLRTDDATNGFDMKLIEIPVRNVESTDENVTSLKLVPPKKYYKSQGAKDGVVLLVATDDKEYEDLGTIDENGNDVELLWVGEVKKLTAEIGEGNTGNLFNVSFNKDFHFKEGYYYRMRFEYSENIEVPDDSDSEAKTEEDDSDKPLSCEGHDVFTLKIVPEYLVWTGRTMPGNDDAKGSLNWNDDANWSRVDSKELFLEPGKVSDSHRHFVTDGKYDNEDINTSTKAYAPLNFTKVIIRGSDTAYEDPYLYEATGTKNVTVGNKNIDWPISPDVPENPEYPDFPGADRVGAVTKDIKYDMVAEWVDKDATGTDGADVYCLPWYMNTCKEIHFKPGASIMNQHKLNYEKAWVDVELDAERWYTLASPLQNVVAGDFYLPSTDKSGEQYSGKAARQETELFQPIEFNTEDYNRFKPAVFQRGWDKSEAKVFELGNTNGYRNVIVTANWSHVYNDVSEQYGGGVGFSIKSDVSALDKKLQPDKVVFRLPKADKEYSYFTQYDVPQQQGDTTKIDRTKGHYRLNPAEGTITASTAQEGNYFLVGNPFMTYMDIREFIKKNSEKLERKFWIVTKKGQITGAIDEEYKNVESTDPELEAGSDPSVVAPMQGFFVKTKTAVKNVELSYDESMMRRYSENGSKVLTTPTRAGGERSMLRITTLNDGKETSSALLCTGFADSGMKSVEAIDNSGLEIPATVYTVGDGMALSINFCDDMEGVEIGVATDEETRTVIRFEGLGDDSGLSLVDKQEYSVTSLYDGLEIELQGAATGRYFLTRSSDVAEIYGGIEWRVENEILTVYDLSASGSLSVKVYDMLGRIVTAESTDGDLIRVPLTRGVYVVEAASTNERKSIKIRI